LSITLVFAKPTDAALMLEVQDGSRVALGEPYGRIAPRAYGTAISTCPDRDCAQDAVQDAFVSMWSSRASYRPERGPVLTWAMSIVRHRAIYLARRRSIGAGLAEGNALVEQQPAAADVSSDFESSAETKRLEQLLLRLPAAQREVIRLAFFGGLTHKQIARRMALPLGTVKGRMRLGLTKLRSGLDQSDPSARERARKERLAT
jgi:RNA polymerase sigma-70 factor, ECF subfamily